jgi:hypothetical protein
MRPKISGDKGKTKFQFIYYKPKKKINTKQHRGQGPIGYTGTVPEGRERT